MALEQVGLADVVTLGAARFPTGICKPHTDPHSIGSVGTATADSYRALPSIVAGKTSLMKASISGCRTATGIS